MPRIPDFQSQVTSTPAPQLQVSEQAPIEAFGGGADLGALTASQKLLSDTETQVAEVKKQADNARVMSGYDALLQTKNTSLYDPNTGAMTKKGQDAATVTKDYGDQFNAAADKIQAELTNDDQRIMFSKARAKVYGELQTTLEKHTYTEMQSFQKETAKATLQTVTDDGTYNYYEPGKVADTVSKIEGLAAQQAKLDGITDPDTVAQLKKNASSTYYTQVLNRMMATEDPGARGFYAAVQGQMTTDDRQKIDVTMKTATMATESQSKADEIMGVHQDLPSALAAARELPPGELRQKVLTQIKDKHADDQAAKQDFDQTRFNQASDIVENSKGQGKIPVTLLSGMSSSLREKLEDRARQLRTGETVDKAGERYYELMNLAAQKPKDFKALNLNEERGSVTPGELEKFIGMQTDMKSGKANKDLSVHRSATQIANDAKAAIGLTGRFVTTPTDKARVKAFDDEYYRRLDDATEQKGGPLTDAEMTAISDKMSVPAVRGMFGGVSKFSFEQGPDDPAAQLSDVRQIPSQQMIQIRAAMSRNGVPYSDAQALSYFNRAMRNTRGQ